MLWIFAERFFMAALRQCEKSEGCFAVFTAQPWTAAVLFKLQFSDGLLVLPPHIFADVKNSMAIAQEETFGPIAPIIKVHGEAEALRVANDTEYGLTSAVFTGDIERGARFALRVQAGMTHVNDATFAESLEGRRIAVSAALAANGLSANLREIIGSPFATKRFLIFFKLMAGPKEQNAAPQNELGKQRDRK